MSCTTLCNLVCRRLIAGRGFALSALVLLSHSTFTRRRHRAFCTIAQLVVFLLIGRIASSLSDVTTRYTLAAIVHHIVWLICRACSIFSMLLAQWRQHWRNVAFSTHAGQWSAADCESVHGSLHWLRPAGVPDRVKSCARCYIAPAAIAVGISLVCC